MMQLKKYMESLSSDLIYQFHEVFYPKPTIYNPGAAGAAGAAGCSAGLFSTAGAAGAGADS